MNGMRQKIQYSLALELVVQGETPVRSYQGAEPFVAKLAPESPALTEQLMEEVCDCKFRSFRQAISVQTGRRFRWKPTGRFGPKRHPVADWFWSRLWRT